MCPMEQDSSSSTSSAAMFAFAFDDKNFSDRVLHVEIIPDCKKVEENIVVGNNQMQTSISTIPVQKKRKRLNSTEADAEEPAKRSESIPVKGGEAALESKWRIKSTGEAGELRPEHEGLKQEAWDLRKSVGAHPIQDGENQEECHGIQEGGEDVANERDGKGGAAEGGAKPEMEIRRRTVHINSAIVAAKSPFFFKLFSNGMLESAQRDATLQIPASEEAALMDVLEFMYTGAMRASQPQSVLAVLLVADKFEVVACMRRCSRLLSQLPMTVELALRYLDLPSSVQAEAGNHLDLAAKSFLANHFRDLVKCGEEALALPLSGVEAILGSDLLHVPMEDTIFDFVLRWSKERYADVEERRRALADTLVPLIRYPQLSYRTLLRALTCSDLQSAVAKALVLEALYFKGDGQRGRLPSLPILGDSKAKERRFRERAYKQRPVKFLVLEGPLKQCIAYFDLRLEELRPLFPTGKLNSQPFCAGGHDFYFSAHCNAPEQGTEKVFGLFLGMLEKPTPPAGGAQPQGVTVDYELAVRMRNATSPVQYPFVVRHKSSYTFHGGKVVGYRNVLSTTWKAFTDDSSPYFHNGIFHLRAELTIRSD